MSRIYTISESLGNFSNEEQAFTENYVEGVCVVYSQTASFEPKKSFFHASLIRTRGDTVEGIFVENDVMYYAVGISATGWCCYGSA